VDDDRRAAIDDAVCRALGRFADRATIDAPELAELLGVARATGYEMVKRGVVPAIHCGNRVLIPVPGLVAVLLGVNTGINGDSADRE
jgi:excisionase family DNA binding protein